MSRLLNDYQARAKQVLKRNQAGRTTRPAPALYPHQWNWDTGFIAIGLAHYDLGRAMDEIESLFDAQWGNGMVPQIVFDPGNLGHYFPEPDFWQTHRSPHAPPEKLTSGITMPPVHAIAVERIANTHNRSGKVLDFIKRIYPKLLALSEYLHTFRDPQGEGLVHIRHPWESGIDNSPTWDGPLKRIAVDPATLPRYQRRDLGHGIAPSMRPSDDDYDRYVLLVDLFRSVNYAEEEINARCPFLIQDPMFNAITCRADEALAHLAEMIGEDPTRPRQWAEQSKRAVREKLWHEADGIFDAWDLRLNGLIHVDTSAGFMPLLAGCPTREQAAILYERLDSASFCALNQGNCFTIPNFDTQKEGFERKNYWRGPVWININWMLVEGLARYGYNAKADALRKDLLQLPIRFGFHEYFDSFEGTGYGSDNFSWTAALFIDLVNEFYESDARGTSLWAKARGLIDPTMVLNSTGTAPPCHNLAAELMRAIKRMRSEFFDLGRGRVNYEGLKSSPAYRDYRNLAAGLKKFDPATLVGRNEKLAFWINLYNAIVVDGIISLDVESSVKEVPWFFSGIAYDIGGKLFKPDDIEHGILRGNARPPSRPFKRFGPGSGRRRLIVSPVDPRIHFALVCGSRSCAPIDYYDAEKINEQLDVAATNFINSSEVLMVPEQGKVMLSEIFRWYSADFGGELGVLDFIHDYLADKRMCEIIRERGKGMEIEYLDYDWNLNR